MKPGPCQVLLLMMVEAIAVYGNPHSHYHHYAATILDTQGDAATPDACDSSVLGDYNMSLHVAGIFILLAVSSMGIYGAIGLGASKYKSQPTILLLLQILKFFGSGVIIATAWIHMLPSSFSQFTSPCLDGFWTQYGTAYTGLFAMFIGFCLQCIEFGAMNRRDRLLKAMHEEVAILKSPPPQSSAEMMENGTVAANGLLASTPCPQHHHYHHHQIQHHHSSHSYGTVSPHTSNHPAQTDVALSLSGTTAAWPAKTSVSEEPHLEHVHAVGNGEVTLHDVAGHSHSIPTETTFHDMSTLMLELGIIFHSLMIGLALGVATTEWSTLMIALSFHQFFEGLGLGTRIAELNTSLFSKIFLYGLMYPLTTPLGVAIGIAVRNVYNANAKSLILTQGIMDALSAGLLIYNAYVELISVEMNHNASFRALPFWRKCVAFGSMWVGAALMAIVGIWV